MGFYLPPWYVYDNKVSPVDQENPLGNHGVRDALRSDIHVYFQASCEIEVTFPPPVVPKK